MTVLVHPTAFSPSDITCIQRNTGLRAVVTGRVVHLVEKNGRHPAMRTTTKTRSSYIPSGPYNGGGAAA